jgi:elongation factor P
MSSTVADRNCLPASEITWLVASQTRREPSGTGEVDDHALGRSVAAQIFEHTLAAGGEHQCKARPAATLTGRGDQHQPVQEGPRTTSGADVALSTNQFRNGNHIEVDGTIFKIVDFQHVKPGKGGAFVRTKLRRATDGNVIDRTFRAGEKFRAVRTESRKMQFLYADGSDAHYMDSESFEQIAIPEAAVQEALRWTRPSSEVEVLFIDERPSDVQLPSAVELEVTQTDPGVRGDSVSSGGTKPATLETGATIQVPLFVEQGERIRVDTRSGEYTARA